MNVCKCRRSFFVSQKITISWNILADDDGFLGKVKGADRVTEAQKTEITRLRLQGAKHKEIAEKTGLSVSSIVSYCHRNKLAEYTTLRVCRFCGKIYDSSEYNKRKDYCSESCYYKWWIRKNGGRKRTMYPSSCRHCGKAFFSIAKKQKFCSASCYHLSRRKGDHHEA